MKAKKWSAIFPCRLMKLSTSSNRMRTGASATAKRFPRTRVPGGADLAFGAQGVYALFSRYLAGHVDPGSFGPVAGIPGVANEGGDSHFVRNCRSGLPEQVLNPCQVWPLPFLPGRYGTGSSACGSFHPRTG